MTGPCSTLAVTLIDVVVERRGALLEQVLEHLQLTFAAMLPAAAVGIALGVLLTRVRRLAPPVLGVASVVQTVPSLALLAVMVPFLGVGFLPAAVALFLYALLPILRNTYTGIGEVDPAAVEVGRGMGMTEAQILWKVQIPMCVSIVMAGVRTSTVICVGIATLATFIGAGGLGDTIIDGLHAAETGDLIIYAGVIPAILLALGLDGLCALAQRLLTPKGLRIKTPG